MSVTVPRHMPALDGLRGVAILLVILTHVAEGWPAALSILPASATLQAASPALAPWLARIASDASHGVQLFFVVSAFTLTLWAGYDRNGLRGFALRRLARVAPAYWVAALGYMLLAGAAARALAPHGVRPLDVIIAILFGSAWQGGASLAVIPGGWSVSCEVAFYLTLPLLLWLLDGQVWRACALTVIATALTSWHARSLMLSGEWSFASYVFPFSQAPVFLFGVTAALLARRSRIPRRPALAMLILAAAILAWPFSPIKDWQVPTHLSFAILCAATVLLASATPPAILAAAWLRRVGAVSYSMYLIHFAVLGPSLRCAEWLAPSYDGLTVLLHAGFTTLASFGLACITFALVERPPIRWAARQSARPDSAPYAPPPPIIVATSPRSAARDSSRL